MVAMQCVESVRMAHLQVRLPLCVCGRLLLGYLFVQQAPLARALLEVNVVVPRNCKTDYNCGSRALHGLR